MLPPLRRVPASGKRGAEHLGELWKHPLHPTAGTHLPQDSSGGCQDKSFIPSSFSQQCGIVTPSNAELRASSELSAGQLRCHGWLCLYLSLPGSQAATSYELWFFRLTQHTSFD